MGAEARKIKDVMAFRKEPSFVKFIPYSSHITDTVISTASGEYLSIFKLRGRTHDCASNQDLVFWHRDLNHFYKSVGNEHVKFWVHQHHRKVLDFPQSEFHLPFAQHFDKSYRRSFSEVPLMVNDLYLTVVYNPVGDLTQKAFSKFDRPTRQELADSQQEAIAALEEICDQLKSALVAYGIEQLGIYYRDKNGNVIQDDAAEDQHELAASLGLNVDALDIDPDDLLAPSDADTAVPEDGESDSYKSAHAYSSALEWLSFLCNGEWSSVPVGRDRIRNYLMHNRLVSSMWGDVVQIRSIDSVQYQVGIEIRDYDEETEPGQLNLLMEADFEYILTQSYCCMSQASASTFLDRQQKSLLETKDRGVSQINSISEAADHVTSRRFIMGWHHATLHTIGETAEQAQKAARKARVMFSQCGITASGIGLASEAAFYARLPANQQFCPRPAAINSWNFVCFAPFHNFMTGKPNNNPWGPAVTLFKTTAGTPLFFNFHVSGEKEMAFGKRPPGNTLILGRVGSGKTTLLNSLLTQSTKFKPRIFCFDKDRGMMPLVSALGGRYTTLREGEPTGFAPAQLEPTKPNVAMVKRLLRIMAEITNNGPITQLDVERLGAAVDHVMCTNLIPQNLRSITAIARQIPRPARTHAEQRLSLAELIEPWCKGFEHGWLFDNPTDRLDLNTHDYYGFDLSDFIVAKDQPAPLARTPMLMYLVYRVRQSIDGTRRSIQVFDEFAQYLDDPYMDIEIKRGLKTDRKKDCIYIFSTQEPNDALDSRIGKTIVQQCVTKLLLENPDADPTDYTRGLNLTAAEYEAMLSIPEFSRQFLVKQGSQSALAVMELKNMEKELSILSGTPDNADRLEKILAGLESNDPASWLPTYWSSVLGNVRGRK